ncbi:spermatogenesis-associated protein 25 [Eublepharis macularius]|uniref:Spermatogenesis-associated protein 25 n=1 Tax=Eublepharis macularius TaxID=481883 RepID=A0AA97JDD2_EUBMA|nr:spermatogenesis-associated protein 25 [Eublepharis macularius]
MCGQGIAIPGALYALLLKECGPPLSTLPISTAPTGKCFPPTLQLTLSSCPLPVLGEAHSTALKLAPTNLPSSHATSAAVSAQGPLRRKLPAARGPPSQASTAQLLSEPDLKHPCRGLCLSRCTPSQEATPRSSRRVPGPSLAQEYPAEQTGNRRLCLPSVAPCPLSQQPKDSVSSRGDLPLAPWGFLPSGFVWMAAQLDPEGGVQPAPHFPPNICILTLAMMIAGIPTVPVPGVREEDMIQAAQDFMAGNQEPGGVEGEAAPQWKWAAAPHLGLSCKRDKQRKRAASRRLLPFFLAQLEK